MDFFLLFFSYKAKKLQKMAKKHAFVKIDYFLAILKKR